MNDHPPLNEGVIFQVHGVSKIYQTGEMQVPALCGTGLILYKGKFTLLPGVLGSGKPILLNILGGHIPTDGHVYYADRNLTRASENELTQYRRYLPRRLCIPVLQPYPQPSSPGLPVLPCHLKMR